MGWALRMGGAEHVRIVALEPGRDVDQQREAGGVALGEAVVAEALNLAEAGLGEGTIIVAGDHALGQHSRGAFDLAGAAEGGHGAAQAVRLGRG